MTNKKFIEDVYEIAFGENAINKGYTRAEVLKELLRFAEESYKWEEYQEEINDGMPEPEIWR